MTGIKPLLQKDIDYGSYNDLQYYYLGLDMVWEIMFRGFDDENWRFCSTCYYKNVQET